MSSHMSPREARELHEDERVRWKAAAQARTNAQQNIVAERELARRRALACMTGPGIKEDPDFPGCMF
jgi:hypothetical protein